MRYQIKEGSQEIMVMAMKMSMASEVAGQKLPGFRAPSTEMTMQADVKEATGGRIAYTFELTESKLLDDEPVAEIVRQAMSAALAKTVGLGGEGVVSDRGRTISAKINVPAMAPLEVKQMIESMQGSLQNMGAPLPEEAVGVGGKWEVKMTIAAGGMRIDQVATYTIRRLLEDGFLADVQVKQSAGRQEMKPPGLPPGAKIELQKLSGEGTGTMEVHLNRLTPNSKIELGNSVDAVIEFGGQTQAMKSSNTSTIAIRPK
jgi:hypothetical protein